MIRTGTAPEPGHSYQKDAHALTGFLARTDDELAALPAAPDRDEAQRALAAAVHTTARRARRRFLQAHAEAVHAELTDDGRAHHRLSDLATNAAELLPGLVPAKERLEAERRLPQRDKEGWETDQALLFWALLGAPRPGRHLLEAMRRPTDAALAALPGFRATGEVDLGVVRVRRDGHVGEVTVDNADCLNAEDDALVAALEVAVDLVLLDDGIRVGTMRGAPMTHPRYAGRRVFSAGINLTALYQGTIGLIDFFLDRELGYISKILRGLSVPDTGGWLPEPMEKPWIGIVDGFAIGGGAQILLCFDRVVATEDAYFTLPALREGIIPGAANLRLPRVAGNRLSRQMVFADRRIDAASPDGRLLCDGVFAEADLAAAIDAAAAELANPAVVNNRRIQHQFEEPEDVFRCYMAAYAVEQARRLYSADLAQALERTWMSRKRG
ncbi:enoyl-CoA hydratase/isomerase family protein [Actinoplanes sp. DH11]|uniref:enoyl-CoA hydratase/isomerase family protein n=1 Tax=Actinoplanes sp. DH11 TaxID=2857011 RepID=UPI001E372D78|nr:enoyl-CoA hydratase/isomerase family protein [Actinoplanes sp. DH11]